MKKLFTCLMVVALLVSATFMLPVMAEENDTVVLVDYENQFLTDLLWATGYYGFETAAPLEGAASLQFNLESSEEWALQTWWGGIGLDQFHGNWVDMTPYEWMGMRVKNTDTEYDFEFSIDITFQNTASTAEAPIANVYLPIKTEQVYTCNADGSDFKAAELTETLYGGVASPFVLIPAGFDGWMALHVDAPRGQDGKVHLVLQRNETPSVYTASTFPHSVISYHYYTEDMQEGYDHDTHPLDPACGYIGKDHKLGGYSYLPSVCFKDLVPAQPLYRAENVLNGYSRPYGQPNLWISGEGKGQWLRLHSETPKHFAELQLIVDTALNTENRRYNDAPELVREFELTVNGKTFHVTGNNYRLLRYEIREDVTDISLKILDTCGENAAHLYAVRFF
jgi:hypothetical protein